MPEAVSSPNVSKAAGLTLRPQIFPIIKVTNLFVSSSPSPFSPFLKLAPTDLGLISYINTIPMEKVRHGTDMVQAPVLPACVFANTTHTHTLEPSHPSTLRVKDRMKEDGGTEPSTSYVGLLEWGKLEEQQMLFQFIFGV